MTPQERRFKEGLLWISEPPSFPLPHKHLLLSAIFVLTIMAGIGWHYVITMP